MIAIPSPSLTPSAAKRAGERVGAAVDLGEGQRPGLVLDHRLVGMVDRRAGDPGRRRGAPAGQDADHQRQLVRAHRADHAGLGERPDVERDVAQGPERPELDPTAEGAHRAGDDVRGELAGHRAEHQARSLVAESVRRSVEPRGHQSSSRSATAKQAMPSPRPIAAHALVGRRLDAHRRRERLGEVPLHLRAVGRRAAAPRRSTVASTFDHLPAQVAERHPQQVERVGVPPALLVRREQGADVAQPGRAEHASITAWVRTSASEWPSRPRSCGISTPPSTSLRPAAKRWAS